MITHAADNLIKFYNKKKKELFVTSPAGTTSAMHDHRMNRVMVYLDAGTMTLTDPTGKVQRLEFKAGEALWSPSSGLHISVNTSKQPVRIVEAELKSKPGSLAKFLP